MLTHCVSASTSRVSTSLLRTTLPITSTAHVHHGRERAAAHIFLKLGRGRKANRHYLQEWAKSRAMKVCKVVLPLDGMTRQRVRSIRAHPPMCTDPVQMESGDILPAAVRANMLAQGARPLDLQPDRPWYAKQIAADSAGQIIEPYMPNKAGATLVERLRDKTKSIPVVGDNSRALGVIEGAIDEAIKKRNKLQLSPVDGTMLSLYEEAAGAMSRDHFAALAQRLFIQVSFDTKTNTNRVCAGQ